MASQSSITIKPPLRDIRGRFAKADEILLKGKREAVRVLGRRWVEIAREEAPNKTGNFSETIRFRSFQTGGNIGFTTSAEQPLGNYIVFGTRKHRIYPRSAGALYFFWGKVGMYTVVPKGGKGMTGVSGGKFWIGKGYVNHPGTEANPYAERAYGRWVVEMKKEINKVGYNFVIEITGKKE